MSLSTRILLLGTLALTVALSACDSPPPTWPADAAIPPSDAAEATATDDAGLFDAGVIDAATGAADADSATDAGQQAPDGQSQAASPDAAQEIDGSLLVRVMAANLSSGNAQTYDPGEGLRLIAGAHPDVVLIQELIYGDNSDAAIQKMTTDTLGPSFVACRGAGGGSGGMPNGILSRWPVTACAGWTDPQVSNRNFTYARIQLPGPRELWAVSLHLLTSSSSERSAEATSLVKSVQGTVPQGALLVLGGDLNTSSVTEACIKTLGAVVVVPGARPVDQNGDSNTNASRSRPHDFVFASALVDQAQVPTTIGASRFDHGLVLDSRVYTPLSEIAPAQQGDSGAAGMEHMGVVKDFLVP
ncbi:MAG TPA: endonuclease/exonuclease/phosphatase family protein [Myxococcales bacterium]|jgi:endonuclease/exonuclease/phosphatase family metal-dependent hydrolase